MESIKNLEAIKNSLNLTINSIDLKDTDRNVMISNLLEVKKKIHNIRNIGYRKDKLKKIVHNIHIK